MSQPTYLFKVPLGNGKYRIEQRELKAVYFREKTRVKGYMRLKGMPVIRQLEGTGKYDHGTLEILSDYHTYTAKATNEGVNAVMRKLSQHAANQLDQIDADMAELRAMRARLLDDAWFYSAEDVPASFLIEQIPEAKK